MKLRDKLNMEENYLHIIDWNKNTIKEWYEKIETLQLNEEKGLQIYPRPNIKVIKATYRSIYGYQMDILRTTYSVGREMDKVKTEYLMTVKAVTDSGWNFRNNYTDMIWLLSIGIMLEIEDDYFTELVNLVEQSNPKDFLIDFLIHSRIQSWERKSQKFLWNRPYQFLEQVISLSQLGENVKAKAKLHEYLQKKWLLGCKDESWYITRLDTNSNTNKTHKGYWSFESGALVKILGLDDSDWQDLSYYPYDMVHYKDSNK